jgi:hypothetical protein
VNDPLYPTEVLTVGVRIPVGGIGPSLFIIASYSTLSILYNMNGCLFPWVKRPQRDLDHSAQSKAEVCMSYSPYCLRCLFSAIIGLKDCGRLGSIAMWTGIGSLTFRRNGSKNKPNKKQETVSFSETSVNFYRSTRCFFPEYRTLHSHRCENLRSKNHTICRFCSLLPVKSWTREYGNSSFLFAYWSVC